jgi:hypothetical protein
VWAQQGFQLVFSGVQEKLIKIGFDYSDGNVTEKLRFCDAGAAPLGFGLMARQGGPGVTAD